MLAKAVELAERQAGSSAGSSRTRRMPTSTRGPRPRRSSRTSLAAARLLGHRLRDGRDAEGRGPRAKGALAGDEDRRVRAGELADLRQRHSPAAAADGSPARATLLRPHLMQGWRRLHPQACRRRDRRRADRRGRADQRRRGAALRQGAGRREGIFCGISGGATFVGAVEIAEKSAERLDNSLHAARHRRALSQHGPLRGRPGGDDRRGAEIAASTPRYRFDIRAAASARPAARRADSATDAVEFVAEANADLRMSPSCSLRSSGASSLVGAEALRGARHPVPLGRPRLGRLPEGRLGGRGARGARASASTSRRSRRSSSAASTSAVRPKRSTRSTTDAADALRGERRAFEDTVGDELRTLMPGWAQRAGSAGDAR